MWFDQCETLHEMRGKPHCGVAVGPPLGVAAVDFVLQLVSLGLSLSPRPLSRGQFLGRRRWTQSANVALNGAAKSDRRQFGAVSYSGQHPSKAVTALAVGERPASLGRNRPHFSVESLPFPFAGPAWK